MKKRIFIVDDNEAVLSSIEGYLREENNEWDIMKAGSGRDFLDLLKIQTPDLMLIDIEMPEMDGWQLLQKIKKNSEWKDIPAIMFSSKPDELTRTLVHKISAGLIEKPFELHELKRSIEKALNAN